METSSSSRNADRMSYLPEAIQSHIVSLLPMKEGKRTSILSRRWKHVPCYLPNMEFDQFIFGQDKPSHHFIDFVHDIIRRHNGSAVRRFLLRSARRDSISSRFINECITFAVEHNVQELVVWETNSHPEELPRCFYACTTLTTLEFYQVKMECPALVEFPLLRCCRLKRVTFRGENMANKFFSGRTFPVLEELMLFCCIMKVETVSISIPSLNSLNIYTRDGTIVQVSCLTLRKLHCVCWEPPNISFDNLSSLVDVYLGFSRYFESKDEVTEYSRFNCAYKTLIRLRNVVTLMLECQFLEFLARDRGLPSSLPSLFYRLKDLTLFVLPIGAHVRVITLLLRSYPQLETLRIKFEHHSDAFRVPMIPLELISKEEYQPVKESTPAPILNCLRTVKIKGYRGGMNEAHVVRYLLENAKFLEEMLIINPQETRKPSAFLPIFTKAFSSVKIWRNLYRSSESTNDRYFANIF